MLCSADRVKNNAGTSDVGIYNTSGVRVAGWTANPVVATWGDVTYNLPNNITNVAYMNFRRYIDTSSNGWARMEVWLYTPYNDTWHYIINDESYRTGNGWETKTINHTDIYSI